MINFPYVSEAEIAALKRLSRSERDDLKRRIISAHPNRLFGTAKPSNDSDTAYIVCPKCGNGSGNDHTPVKCSFKGGSWLYHCFKCNDLEGDLLSLIANEEHLTLSNADDMAKALTIGASLIGFNFNVCTSNGYKLPFKKGTDSNSDNFNLAKDKSASQSDSQPNLQSFSQIKGTDGNCDNFNRLAEARSNLQMQGTDGNSEYCKKTFRGLSRATLVKLNWGFLKNYKHPLNTFVFQAIIIPNDKGGILARAIEGTKKSNISPTGTTTICLPTDNQILFIVEGAIDAASIAQATDFQYGVIAIGGTSGIKNCVARLTELSLNKTDTLKIIVMLDYDDLDPEKDSGQIAAKKLVAELNQLGFAVVNKIICDTPRRDPNLILQEEGDEALRIRIENIVADALKEFQKFDNRIADKLQSAQRTNAHTDAEPIGISNSNNESAPRQERADSMNEFKNGQAGGNLADLMTTREVAEFLGVSRKTVENWRTRKLFGCYFFTADEKHGDTLYYYRERVEQLKAVYQKGILQDMYKLARKNPETTPPDYFQKSYSTCEQGDFKKAPSSGGTNNFGEELSFRHAGFFSADEVADIFGVTVRAVQQWVKRGQLKEDMLGHNGDFYFGIDNVLNFTPPKEKTASSGGKVADDKIAQWQKVNGVIEPKILADLVAFEKKINVVVDFADAATDTSNVKFLGYCRFYPFAHVDQKFFAELRDAVSKAKSAVNAWNKHIKDTDKYNSSGIGAKRELDLSKKPADSDFALAAINPRLVSEEVDKYAKKARREHEKWLIQHKCDEINAKRQADREAYEEAPPSTQQEVEDCPIDLILPEGATFTDAGIKYVDWDKPAKEGRIRVEVCQNPIAPTKFFSNAESGLSFYEVAIRYNNRWHFQLFPARTFMDSRAVLALADYGLKISEPRLLVKFFAKFFAINENNGRLPQKRIYSQPGWHDGDFISPTGGEDYIVKRDGIDYDALFAQKGNPDDWLDLFKKTFRFGENLYVKEYAAIQIIAFIFGYALSAHTLKINGLPNQLLHVWGNKSSAKTAILKFALSVFGNPTEGKLLRNMAATDKNKMAIAAGLNDFPVGYDEVESANKFSDLEKACYDFFSGVVNQANKRNGEVRAAEHFRGVQIMTGENPILDVDTAKGGSLKRLVQIQISQPLLPVEDARQLHVFLNNNYGHFRHAWIDYVKTHADALQTDFENTIKTIETVGATTNSAGELYFSRDSYEQTNFFAVTNSFVNFFHFLILLGIKDSFDTNNAADCIITIMRLLPTADELDDYCRACLLIRSFIDGKSKFFYRESYDTEPTTAKYEPYEKYGILFETGDVAFFPAYFKSKIWNELGIRSSYARFLTDAYSEGHLICHDSGDKRKAIRYHGKLIKVYYFKAAAFNFGVTTDNYDS